ncbi:MAG: phosphoenolpyruvate--protein phosphotransferase [Alphaproteobacteria bacterium]
MTESPPRASEPAGGGHVPAGPRLLLRQMRSLMADRRSAQERLNRLVMLIASNMVSEVCSIYLLRKGVLELFATQGLNPAAVHRTTLAIGEGLVGEIARTAQPLNLSDAQHHPKFAYRPETGEDPFQSFLGVPILHSGEVLGVLTVQNMTQRHYGEEEIEALLTVAMVLAEVVSTLSLEGVAVAPEKTRNTGPLTIEAQSLVEGIAIGHAVMHEPRVKVTKLISEDTEAELARLNLGLEALQASIDEMLIATDGNMSAESRDVLETYKMFAHDRGWSKRLREVVLTGLTAEAAVERVQGDLRARMNRSRDAYLRERAHDLDDLSNRLLRLLVGKRPTVQADEMPADAIILARTMGPAELLDYDRAPLRGLVLEEGTSSSHVAIVGRAFGLPILGLAADVLQHVETGDLMILDGELGELHIRPTPELLKSYRAKLQLIEQRQAIYATVRDKPAVTLDGTRIHLNMNAGLLVDLPNLARSGAEGIGLFRTELQFMVSPQMPRLEVQRKLYSQVLEAAGDKPVVFRTVDLGGDKTVSYMATEREENPALGWRAIRIALDRPGLLRYQARALIEAAVGKDLRLMFPMVSTVDEFAQAKSLFVRELDRARRRGQHLPKAVHVGTMMEVPALAFQLTELLPHAQFVSIGSNDLLQFFYAVDRQNARLSDRYDILSTAFLRFVREIVTKCDAAGVPVSLCGEMAGRPLEAMALLGIGLRTISMPPTAIGPVKLMLQALDLPHLAEKLSELLACAEPNLRGRLREYAATSGIEL